MSDDILFGSDYHDKFDTHAYLKSRYGKKDPAGHFYAVLRCYHDVFQSLPNGLEILDYGTGPSILTTISASRKASEIILSAYTKDNRSALRRWLEGSPDAFDWSPYFRRVVEDLEGKGKKEVEERQKLVQRIVKAVVHCDLTQDPPIERGYDQQYDVVMSSLCLEAASQTPTEYKNGMKKLAKLLKPGGALLIYGEEVKSGPQVYVVDGRKFKNFGITPDFATEAMVEAGITDVNVEHIADLPPVAGTVYSMIFFSGTKRQ